MKKNILIIIVLALISINAEAQDVIYTRKNDTLRVKVTEIASDFVKYRFVNEDAINNISFDDFYSIVLSSGRCIKGRDRIVINGVEDWKKVVITTDAKMVEGLKAVKEISETATSSLGAYGSLEKMKSKAKDGLKRKAAALGCHMVLITEDNSRDGKTNQEFKWTKASLVGTAYTYE